MTTATAEARSRPAIEPIRTTGPDLNVRSLRSRIVQKSPSWTPSPLSPRSLPIPRVRLARDDDTAQDDGMNVDQVESPKLDPLKQDANLRNVSLRPIAELALPSPSTLPSRRSPLSAPLFAPHVFQRPTLAEETRSMLLHAPGSDSRRNSVFLDRERRQSAPGGPLHTRAIQIARQRDDLHRRRLAGSYRPREPEILVQPTELRRLSMLPSSDTGPPSPYPVDGRLTTRVVVHSPGKKSLVLTRTFDLDELRATLPPISPVEQTDRRASVACLQPPPTFHDHLHRVTLGTDEVPTVPSREPATVGLLLAREEFHVKACLLLLFDLTMPEDTFPFWLRSFCQSLSSLVTWLRFRCRIPVHGRKLSHTSTQDETHLRNPSDRTSCILVVPSKKENVELDELGCKIV
ncbi:hypothetical protein NXS19_000851 [Fusarium pseudograminearum]|nr:hypothetical protein NXS19_000851 [Fusarium pseudograminearum]